MKLRFAAIRTNETAFRKPPVPKRSPGTRSTSRLGHSYYCPGLPAAATSLTIGGDRTGRATEKNHADPEGPARHDPRRFHRHRRHGPVDVPEHHGGGLFDDGVLAHQGQESAVARR